jgi:DNA-directed RNA polymerase subunit beta'
VEPTEDARAAVYPPPSYEPAPAGYSFGQGPGEAIPLEEYDSGAYNR